tara:strand:+ start:2400 stop:2585 length:186 start_codon:yes stop_codon:yes gene_type:complete
MIRKKSPLAAAKLKIVEDKFISGLIDRIIHHHHHFVWTEALSCCVSCMPKEDATEHGVVEA